MKKILLLVFLAFFQLTSVQIAAQTQIPPAVSNDLAAINASLHAYEVASPNQSSFNKVNFIPISNYTGRSNVTIPLYEIKSGDITVPITLSYNTSGVKVHEVPSFVGSNWALNAGGKVSKTIRGIEDFSYSADPEPDPNGSSFAYLSEDEPFVTQSMGWSLLNEYKSHYSLNDLLGATAPFKLRPNSGGGIFSTTEPNTVTKNDDQMPDVYKVSAPGIATRFVHTKEGTPFELEATGAVIKSTFGLSHPINFYGIRDGWEGKRKMRCVRSINITNPQGLEYEFANLDVSQSADINPVRQYNRKQKLRVHSYHKVDAYNLSRIRSAATLREVNFHYEDYRFQVKDARIVYNYRFDGHNFNKTIPSKAIINTEQIFFDKYPQQSRLKQISFDHGTVDFIYNINRLDLIGEKALEYIVVKNRQGQQIKKIKFEYSYFIADTGCNEVKCKRLKLDRIRIFGSNGNEIPGYDFQYNSQKLPERDTFNNDFLGYANAPTSELIGGSPTLYFSEGKGDLSIFPIKRNDSDRELLGVFSMEANLKYAKAGILERITYPTGAKTQFAYELNSFLLEGKEIKGAGLRVKSKRIYDKDGGQQIMDYRYVDFDGKSSGRLNAIPRYGLLKITKCNDDFNKLVFDIFLSSQSQAELTDGAFVGYGRVLKKNRANNGVTEYTYSNSEEFPDLNPQVYELSDLDPSKKTTKISSCQVDFFHKNGGFTDITIDQGLFRGKLQRERVFDQQGTLLSKRELTYAQDVFNTIPLSYLRKTADLFVNDKSFARVTKYSQEIDLVSQRYLPVSETITKYYKGRKKQRSVSFQEYHPALPFVKTQYLVNSIGDTTKQRFYYPNDKNELINLSEEESIVVDQLINQNRTSAPLQVEEYYNNTLQKTSLTTHKDWGGFIAPKSKKYAKGDYPLEDRIHYHSYNRHGMPTSLSGSDGVPVSYLYGYQDALPIAKLVNLPTIAAATTNNLAILANNDTDVQSENALRQGLDKLRNTYPNAQITTYTHDPLIGPTSITTPNGEHTSYAYDEFNRLKITRDRNKKILEEFCYGYREGDNSCGTNAPEGVFIEVTKGVTYNVPMPNPFNAPEYQWGNTFNNRKSLHPVLYYPRPALIHPSDIPFTRTTPIPDFYNLPYPKSHYNSGFEAIRKGIAYKLVGLGNNANYAVQWSLVVNGILISSNWNIAELPNVLFPPQCFDGKKALLIATITTKNDSYSVESNPFTLSAGLDSKDDQEFSNILSTMIAPKSTSELCQMTTLVSDGATGDTIGDIIDEHTPWEETSWTTPISPDPDGIPIPPTDTRVPKLRIQLSAYREDAVPIPNNSSAREYHWEGIPKNRKSLHPVFYYPRPQGATIPTPETPINVGLFDQLPYPRDYYTAGWSIKKGGYRVSVLGLETITYPHRLQWMLRVDGKEEPLIRIPESSSLFYVPSALNGKEGKVICKIIKMTGKDAGTIVELQSETTLFQNGLQYNDNKTPPLQQLILGN